MYMCSDAERCGPRGRSLLPKKDHSLKSGVLSGNPSYFVRNYTSFHNLSCWNELI